MQGVDENGRLDCVAAAVLVGRACFRCVVVVARLGRICRGSSICSRKADLTQVEARCVTRIVVCTRYSLFSVCLLFHYRLSPCSLKMFMHLGCQCFTAMGGRSNIRNRYHIDGGGCTDCLCHTFCSVCALTQESREIKLEERSLSPAKQG